MSSPFQDYLRALRSPATRKTYKNHAHKVGDPNKFLELARENSAKAEKILLEFVIKERDRVSAVTVSLTIITLKQFLEFYDVGLNWKKIKAAIPIRRVVARDRAPTRNEIRKLLEHADLRLRSVILILVSSGVRRGSLTDLNYEDLKVVPSGVGVLTIYRGYAEEYDTFVSPECVRSLTEYIEMRRAAREVIGPKSPLIRDKWSWVKRANLKDASFASRISSETLAGCLEKAWVQAGVRTRERIAEGGSRKRKEFKVAHGFRKFFRTQASQEIKGDDVEVLMGHILPYYKPSKEHLETEYLKAVTTLTISEVEEVKQKNAEDRSMIEEKYDGLARTVLQLQAEMSALKNGVN